MISIDEDLASEIHDTLREFLSYEQYEQLDETSLIQWEEKVRRILENV